MGGATFSVKAGEVTNFESAGTPLTLAQLKALSGTGGHVAFANLGSGQWTKKWLANPSANSSLTLSTVQLYTITDGTVSGKYHLQRCSDDNYRTNGGWDASESNAENIEFRAYSASSLTVSCDNPISIHNNSGTQWNINAGSFGGALNAWAAYAAFGPFYLVNITLEGVTVDGYPKSCIATNGTIFNYPVVAGKTIREGGTSVTVNGADINLTLHYDDAASYDYTVAITGNVPDGTTFSIKGDAVANGDGVSYGTEVQESDVVVTFPVGYEYMEAEVDISASTITINCNDTRWPINFPKTQTFTRNDRHINSVTLTSESNTATIDGFYTDQSTLCYQDLTASKSVTFLPNTSIKPSFSMTGIWQHAFIYIDLNNDGDFTDEGELVSKVNEGNPDLSTAIPAFTSPSSLGTYRMRFKTDWSSIDPGGNPGPSNYIIDNGGMIVDITLVINEDYTSILTSITKPFTDYPADNGYFRMTSTNATNLLGMINTASTNDGVIDKEEYDALMGYFNNYVRFPETGYYLIKNADSDRYLAYGTPGQDGKAKGLITTDGAITPANIIKLTKESGLNNYTISSQGLNVQARPGANNTFPMTADDGVNFSFIPQTASTLKITNTDSYVDNNSPGTLFEVHWTAPYAVVNWEPFGAQGQWTVEAATSFDVTLNSGGDGKYYATLYLPFDVTLSEACAYTLTLNGAKDGLTLSTAFSEVPAGTPVLLRHTGNSVTATINNGDAFNSGSPLECDLTGSYTGLTLTQSEDKTVDYVLGVVDDAIGFYHWAGTALSPNRAYFEASKLPTEVKGLVLSFDNETGIETMRNSENEKMRDEVFDLSGRRVAKPTKGIYINNGKKVVIK